MLQLVRQAPVARLAGHARHLVQSRSDQPVLEPVGVEHLMFHLEQVLLLLQYRL